MFFSPHFGESMTPPKTGQFTLRRWRLDDETVTTVTEHEQASCDKAEATEGAGHGTCRAAWHGGRDLPTNPKRIGILNG